MAALAIVPMRQTLYSIEEHLQALLDTAEMVSPEQEGAFIEDLAQALTNAVEKRDAVGHWMSHCESQIEFAKEEIDRLRARKSSFESALERIKSYVATVILKQEPDSKGKYPKLEGKTVTFSIRKNPAKVDVLNEPGVPLAYKSVTLTMPAAVWETILDGLDMDTYQGVHPSIEMQFGVDKRAVKAALDAGTLVPGADFAPQSYGLVRK